MVRCAFEYLSRFCSNFALLLSCLSAECVLPTLQVMSLGVGVVFEEAELDGLLARLVALVALLDEQTRNGVHNESKACWREKDVWMSVSSACWTGKRMLLPHLHHLNCKVPAARFRCDHCPWGICSRSGPCDRHRHHACNTCHAQWRAGQAKGLGKGH